MKTTLESISKIPLVSLRGFFIHVSFLFSPILREYALRKEPHLDEKSCANSLIPIFEMDSRIFVPDK